MNCQCGTEMMLQFQTPDHYADMYSQIFWCPDCGRLLDMNEDDENWLTPAITKQDERKRNG